jgi:ligand-binding sensor domain-containing protein
MYKKLLFLVLMVALFLAFTSKVFAQYDNWLNYTEGSIIYALEKDNNFIWAGTRGGLVRINTLNNSATFYDKINSGLPDNHVIAIAVDSTGKKWIGTWNGLAVFDGTTWQVYKTDNSSLPENVVTAITVSPDNVIWIGTINGNLIKIENAVWTIYNNSNSGMEQGDVYSIAIDNNNTIWTAIWDFGLVKFNGSAWSNLTSSNSDLPSGSYYDINVVKDTIWVSTTGGLTRIIDTNWTIYNYIDFGLPGNAFYKTLEDDNGNLWIGTAYGLIQLKPNGQKIKYTSQNSGLPCDAIYSIESDNSGKLWFGTFGSGLVSYNSSNWNASNTSETDLINNDVSELCFDKNHLLWGISPALDCNMYTCSKIFSYNFSDGVWHTYTKAEMNLTFFDCSINSIMVDDSNNKWFLAPEGLLKYDNINWRLYEVPSSIAAMYSYSKNAVLDTNNVFYVVTNSGVLCKKDSVWLFISPTDMGMTGNFPVFYMACVDIYNNIWFLVSYNNGGTKYYLIKYDGSVYTSSLIPDQGGFNYPYTITADSLGNVWVGFIQGGLFYFDGTSFINHWPVGNADPVGKIDIDINNNLWISSNGLYKYTPGGSFSYFNSANSGLSGDAVTCVAFDQYNDKWIGTYYSGISEFNEDSILFHVQPAPDTIIESNFPIIFPNPAADFIYINLASYNIGEQIEIEFFDIMGRLIEKYEYTASDETHKLDISNFSAGVYLVVFRNSSSKKCYKIVIL